MTYRELLNAYKNGALDDKTKQQIIEDIEKQDAISEYLFDQELSAGTDYFPVQEEGTAESAEASRLTALVQKAVHKTLMKAGLITGVLVLLVVALCAFVLPRLTDYFYYRPDKIVWEDEETHLRYRQMDLDLSVWSELYLPGAFRQMANTESEGWGKYSIAIPELGSPDGRYETVTGRLVRNKLTLYEVDTLRRPVANAFVPPEGVESGFTVLDADTMKPVGGWGDRETQQMFLEELDENQWYVGYLSLSELMAYEDFYSWFDALDLKTENLWVEAYVEGEDGHQLSINTGFLADCSGYVRDAFSEEYPFLSPIGEEQHPDPASARQMKQHFISLLRYQADHPRLGQIMGENMSVGTAGEQTNYRHLINLMENQPLRTYGFAVTAQKDALQKLFEEPTVAHIYAVPLR